MFPIRDHNPHFRTPFTTYFLVIACVGIWILFQRMGMDPGFLNSICDWGLIPVRVLGEGMPMASIFEDVRRELGLGHADGPACVGHNNSSLFQLISSMFLHGGWFHLIGNMWFLWIFGNNVEDAMGRLRFLAFYILCGLGAAFTQMYMSPESQVPMVGASGAIGGVMGAYISLYPRTRIDTLIIFGIFFRVFELQAWVLLGYWFLIQLFSAGLSTGGGGGVAFAAHVGGFIAGLLLVWIFRDQKLYQMHRRNMY